MDDQISLMANYVSSVTDKINNADNVIFTNIIFILNEVIQLIVETFKNLVIMRMHNIEDIELSIKNEQFVIINVTIAMRHPLMNDSTIVESYVMQTNSCNDETINITGNFMKIYTNDTLALFGKIISQTSNINISNCRVMISQGNSYGLLILIIEFESHETMYKRKLLQNLNKSDNKYTNTRLGSAMNKLNELYATLNDLSLIQNNPINASLKADNTIANLRIIDPIKFDLIEYKISDANKIQFGVADDGNDLSIHWKKVCILYITGICKDRVYDVLWNEIFDYSHLIKITNWKLVLFMVIQLSLFYKLMEVLVLVKVSQNTLIDNVIVNADYGNTILLIENQTTDDFVMIVDGEFGSGSSEYNRYATSKFDYSTNGNGRITCIELTNNQFYDSKPSTLLVISNDNDTNTADIQEEDSDNV